MEYSLGRIKFHFTLIPATLLLYACGPQTTSNPAEIQKPGTDIPSAAKSDPEAMAGTDIYIELPQGDAAREEDVAQLSRPLKKC